MKILKIIGWTLIVLSLIIALSSLVFTQTKSSNTVSRDDTISFLIEQNQSAEKLIEKQNNRIKDLEAELATEKENSNSLGKSYESAKSEIDYLKKSNAALEKAVAVNESTIELLKADNDKQREKVKKAQKAKWKAYGVAAVAFALKIFL